MYEPLVYYCGALKNLSQDSSNQRALLRAGALTVLCGALATMTEHVGVGCGSLRSAWAVVCCL